MSKQTYWTYSVSGSGAFPIDMLRYDGAFPAQSSDSRMIRDTEQRTINLASHAHRPTVARWASYGWTVLSEGLLPDRRMAR